MATSSDDLLRIHHQYPLLSFFLSLCNPSNAVLSAAPTLSSEDPFTASANQALYNEKSDGYLHRIRKGHWSSQKKILCIPDLCHDLLFHTLAISLAVVIIWQSILLGARGVLVFSCWTWHEPFTWVGIGGLTHLLSALAWRLCLGKAMADSETHIFPVTGRWRWTLATSNKKLRLELKHPKVARFFGLTLQVVGLMNYGKPFAAYHENAKLTG